MRYRKREELTILKVQNDEENISFNKLKEVIMARPSNVIYCEKNGKLHGIITMGDIQRACADNKNEVAANTHFTSLNTDENMKAHKIFDEKASINALPVLDDDILTGDWIRWDDLRYGEYMFGGGRALPIIMEFA